MINDKDLDRALKAVPKIYSIKRKTIQLDEVAIKEAQQQHIGTVELLNKYLEEDSEDDIISTNTHEITNENINKEISHKNIISRNSIYTNEIGLSTIQIDTLGLFQKSNLSIPQSELEVFAKSKGVFKNQLIESINEICYEILDDVLIEEEDEHYSINPNYHQRILAE